MEYIVEELYLMNTEQNKKVGQEQKDDRMDYGMYSSKLAMNSKDTRLNHS